MSKKIQKLADLQPHEKNPNRGTERGRYLIEKSLQELGAGRSIVADKEGRIIGGNHVLEVAAEMGLPVRVVNTKGEELVVVQRDDLDLQAEGDDRARQLAYADNRSSEINFDLDPLRFSKDLQSGLDLSDFYREDEARKLLAEAGDDPGDGGEGGGGGVGAPVVSYQLVFDSVSQQDRWYEFVKWLRERYDGETIASRLHAFLQEVLER